MLKRNWALIALIYLGLAEALSWAPVPDLSLCLVQPEHSQQAANHDDKKYCPAFHVGAALALEKTDHWLERHDKSVIGTFTIVLAISTIGLWLATNKLWAAGEKQFGLLSETAAAQSRDMQESIAAAQQSADAAQTQAAILAAVEGPMPLVNQIKLAQYANIPGEILISDQLPPGPIPSNCRILVAVENKGRTILRIVELCIEKFTGSDLPSIPDYSHATSFNFYLEKGPIWLRGSDAQIAIGPADIGRMHAVYPRHGAFWVYGYFAYPDLLNRRVEHKFCVRWDQTVGFVPDNRPGYT
jgi:hypothetical protein